MLIRSKKFKNPVNEFRVVDRADDDIVICECSCLLNASFIAWNFDRLFNGFRVVQHWDSELGSYVDLEVAG